MPITNIQPVQPDSTWTVLVNEKRQPLIFYTSETDGELNLMCVKDPLYIEQGPAPSKVAPVFAALQNPAVIHAEPGDDVWDAFVQGNISLDVLREQGFDGAALVQKSTGILDRIQALTIDQIIPARDHIGSFKPASSSTRYAVSDPRYMFAGPQAETSSLSQLDQARQLESRKLNQSTIWKETGWLRGVDGNWRFEISDAEARLKIGVPEAVEDEVFERLYREISFKEERGLIKALYRPDQPDYLGAFGHTREDAWRNLQCHLIKREFQGIYSIESVKGQTVRLGDVLDHPTLFAAYPRLTDMPVTFDDHLPDHQWGEFDHGSGMTINANLGHEKILRVILHEVQHSIQNIEGFAYGGQPEQRFASAVKDRLKSLSAEQQRNVDQWTSEHAHLLDAEQASSDMVTYALMYRSMERLRQYAQKDRPSGVLRLIRNETGWVYHDKVRESAVARRFDELQRSWMELPKRHRMQARNRFLGELCLEAASCLNKVIPEPIIQQFREDSRQINSLLRSLERQASAARAATQPLRELKHKEKTTESLLDRHYFSSAYQVYQALAGEIEARNTETRQTMTDEQRRQTPPEETADVKRDEAIVIFRDQRNFKVEVPYRSALTAEPLQPAIRKAPKTGPGLTKIEAQAICDSLMVQWKDRPDIHAVDRISELPQTLQRDIWQQRAVQDVRAAFHNNAVYVIAPRLPDRNALEEVLLHEVVGHYGLRALLGNKLAPTLERIYEAMQDSDLAQEIRSAYFRTDEFDPTNANHRQLVAEELMAKLAESGAHQDISESELYEAEVRDGLRDLGFRLPLTRTDILSLLRGAEEVLHNGGLSRPSPADTFFRRAYHGSPYQFDAFSLKAIGQGEGAQAFGWGLYFAARREVAEYYRDTLSDGILIGQLSGWDVNGASSVAKDLLRDLPMSAAIAYAQAREGKLRGLYDGVADELRTIEAKGQQAADSFLYEVDIPDDEELLDADKPLAEQPLLVYNILRDSAVLEMAGNEPWQISAQMTDGHGLYDLLRQWFIEDDSAWDELGKTPYEVVSVDSAVSQYLNKLGIPGLRYLDANSRADGSGQHNYVIWDDRVVTIRAINDQIHQAVRQSEGTTQFSRKIQEHPLIKGQADNDEARHQHKRPSSIGPISPPLSLNAHRDQTIARGREQGDQESDNRTGSPESNRGAKPIDTDEALLDKALFVIRWRMMEKLGWFDRLDSSDKPQPSLSETWADTHAYFFDTHARTADELNLTLAELQQRYLGELAQTLDAQADSTQSPNIDHLLHYLETLNGETWRFLNAWSQEPSEMAFKARRALRSLEQQEWPFEGNPKRDHNNLDRFMADSQMKHANGKPRRLYHATESDFTEFDPVRSSGVAGAGIYMTTEKPVGDDYGTFVMPLYASIKNPIDFSAGDHAINRFAKAQGMKTLSECESIPELRSWSAEFRKRVLEAGYDGALIAGPDGQQYVVAYHANQVKSALGNSGLFNPADPDIRYKRGASTGANSGIQSELNLSELRLRIPELADQVHRAYEQHNYEEAERLDAELETVFDDLEHILADTETYGYIGLILEQQDTARIAGFDALAGADDDTEASLEACLASTYAQYLDPAHHMDVENAVINGRSNLQNFYADVEGVTDEQILQAMKDAHDHQQSLRKKGGPTFPTFGIPITQANLDKLNQQEEPHLSDEPMLG